MLDWGECPLVYLSIEMRVQTRERLVAVALCAMGLGLLFSSGCRKGEKTVKKEQSTEVLLPSNAPAAYMNDPVFRQQVAEKRKELQAIVNERAPLVARMEELVREHGEDLAALQKIDEWTDLHRKVVALNAKYEEVRARQLKIVKDRISK